MLRGVKIIYAYMHIGDDLDYREESSLVHFMKINLIKIKTANVNLIKSSCVSFEECQYVETDIG